MVRIPALFLRLSVIACAVAMLLLCARGVHAQGMVAGGAFQTAPQTTTSVNTMTGTASNASPRMATPSQQAPIMQQPPGTAGIQSGVAVQPATLYDAQTGPTAPVYGAPSYGAGAPSYGGSPPSYGVTQPALYSAQAEPAPQTQGYYDAQVGPIQGAPQYAPQQQYGPQYAPQYAPQQMPQYAAPAQPQYAQPQYAQPQYAAQPGAAPYSPGSQYGMPQRLLAAAPGAPQPGPPSPGEGGYTLGPGDKVHLTVYDEPDLSGDFSVDGNGAIGLPLIGTMRAQGATKAMLEAAIRGALSPGYLKNPRVNVEITAYRPIYVVGAVVKPGQYAYINDMTMLNAVALAGGFTDQAVDSTVYVRHEGETQEQPVSTAMPLLIRPGDTVRVKTTILWQALDIFAPLSSPVALAAAVH